MRDIRDFILENLKNCNLTINKAVNGDDLYLWYYDGLDEWAINLQTNELLEPDEIKNVLYYKG